MSSSDSFTKLPAWQYFNKPDGPCDPGYASFAPVHGRHQALWQQPPPSKQQLTYNSEVRPHEAPLPSFNNCSGAGYHWYSQQFSAPNSFDYGAHTNYGNHQHQWEQLPSTLELPIASWQHPPPPLHCRPTPSKDLTTGTEHGNIKVLRTLMSRVTYRQVNGSALLSFLVFFTCATLQQDQLCPTM
ncbi:uncharacterized protein LOC125510867 [Triticum urartu]|uniref:uncharacterized protein LOC125510867 n=1 Tax=Triticum urartu TaxID=4572 RepID=UPI0020431CE2|nr:uncharacterized protein LOC125510867 [Triticum urartu]